MNQYEIAVLYDPDLEIDLDKAENRVKKIITDNKGKIANADNWGKRKLAYPINKQDNAIYVFYVVELEPASVKPIEAALNITGEVIRFLITRPDLKKQAKAEAERAAKAKKNAERASNESDADETEE